MLLEAELEKNRQRRKEMQISLMKEKLEKRKIEKMKKLKEKQELERAQVGKIINFTLLCYRCCMPMSERPARFGHYLR